MQPAPAAGVLVTAFLNHVYGLDVVSGQYRWEVKLEGVGEEVEIALEEGVVIAVNADHLTFIDHASGGVHASLKIPGQYHGRPTMIVSGGFVYIAKGGEVSCFTTRGQFVWLQPFTGKGIGNISLGLPGAIRQADDAGRK